jgi:hypothetical protein
MTYKIVYIHEEKKQTLTVLAEHLISTLMTVTGKGYKLLSVNLVE